MRRSSPVRLFDFPGLRVVNGAGQLIGLITPKSIGEMLMIRWVLPRDVTPARRQYRCPQTSCGCWVSDRLPDHIEGGEDTSMLIESPVRLQEKRSRPRVGLALGSGSARGWAHIGVIRALEQAGIRPDVVCGTSIGALVGAAYAAGELDRFEQWVLGLEIRDVVALMDVSLRSGLFKGQRLMDFFRRHFADRQVEELTMPFAAVATALQTGVEIWLRRGSTLDAVRASIALPGLFAPVLRDGMVLVDGGLVNPVPVSLARAMGADVVIAVDLGSDILGRHLRAGPPAEGLAGVVGDWIPSCRTTWAYLFRCSRSTSRRCQLYPRL